ncbi:MAG: hypothetical protein ACXVA9_07795 [Bdellovibrionales bacterium]
MRSRKLNFLFSIVVITFVTSGRLARGEEEAKGEGGDKKGALAPLPKDQKEFLDKTQRLNSLGTRIEEAEKQFNELVNRKATEKSADEKERIIKQMNEVTKDRNKSADEYNKVKSDLSLRFPNQGQQLNRRYQTQTKKSVEELEGAAGLDELLTHTKKIVEKKFAPFAPPVDEKKPKPKIAQPEDERPKKLRLEK